jgi:hypothetical protein
MMEFGVDAPCHCRRAHPSRRASVEPASPEIAKAPILPRNQPVDVGEILS